MDEKKISVKELAEHICKQMPAQRALEILLASQMKHYQKLKLEKQPEDNPEEVSPYFIIVAAALDMGWGIMIEKGDDDAIIRGLTIGTEDYIKDLVGFKPKPTNHEGDTKKDG